MVFSSTRGRGSATVGRLSRRGRRAIAEAGRLGLETLEKRCLMSGVTSYALGASEFPVGATTDSNGAVWYADNAGGLVKVELDVSDSPVFTQFASGNLLWDVYFNANDNLIYASSQLGSIDQYDLSGNLLNSFAIDLYAGNTDRTAVQMTVAEDGALWFTTIGAADGTAQTYAAEIGRLDLATGTFDFYSTGTNDARALGITTDLNGDVWFTLDGVGLQDANGGEVSGLSAVGRVTVGAAGYEGLQVFTVPSPGGAIYNLATGADGTVWYAQSDDPNDPSIRPAARSDALGRIVINGDGSVSISEIAIPKTEGEGVLWINDVAVDAAGNVWFTELLGNRIGKLDVTTGDFERYATGGQGAYSITISGDDVWATGIFSQTLLRVDTSVAMSEVLATQPNIDAIVAEEFNGPVAMFTSSLAGDFTYVIDYGDGTTESGIVANDPSGIYTINGIHTYAAEGTFVTRVTITAATGDSVSTAGTAVVTESSEVPFTAQGVNVSAQEDTALAANVVAIDTVVVATFTGPVGSYSATINWGDSTTSVGEIVALGNGTYAVKVLTGQSKSYATQGTYAISVTISNGVETVVANATASITDTPLVASQNLTVNALIGRVVLDVVATFTDDIDLGVNAFRAVINWGDGSTSRGIILRDASNPGSFIVIGVHVYRRRGSFNINTLITNLVEGQSATATATITL